MHDNRSAQYVCEYLVLLGRSLTQSIQGTWQFMSLRCLQNPALAVLLPDELESFTHALLYNGVRFLCHDLDHIEGFVTNYFDESPLNGKNRNTAPHGKSTSIFAGMVMFGSEPLIFGDPVEDVVHPLNTLFNSLMEIFRSRYVILRWQAAQEAKTRAKDAPVTFHETTTTSIQEEEDIEDLAERLKRGNPAFPSSHISSSILTVVESAANSDLAMKQEVSQDVGAQDKVGDSHKTSVPAPTKQDYAIANCLKTHQAVINIFEKQLKAKGAWPSAGTDMVGYDRLNGYRAPARAVPCSGKPSKQVCTVPVGRISAPDFGQASGDSKGKRHGDGDTVTIIGLGGHGPAL